MFNINRKDSATNKKLVSFLNSNLLNHASKLKPADQDPITFVLGKPDFDKDLKVAADKIKSKHTITRLALVVQKGPFYCALYTIKGTITTILIVFGYKKGKKHFSKKAEDENVAVT